MQKLVGILLLFLISTLFFLSKPKPLPRPHIKNTPLPITKITKITSSILFVPYWSLKNISSKYDTDIYFGITPGENGIDQEEQGYKNLSLFLKNSVSKQKFLAVRMAASESTEKILQDTITQEKVIEDSLKIAENNDFDGIVLDLEYNGLALPSVVDSITNLSTHFAKTSHDKGLLYYQTIFGDALYLHRPYDVTAIGESADEILVMAYDFHKAKGTPGPNFPLTKRVDADFDFSQMVADFSEKIPREKLTIVFGMFGYDWTVDEQGRSTKQAISLSDNEITSKFLNGCQQEDCVLKRDSQTQEPSVTYSDEKGNHVVWFEDMQSIKSKEKILEQSSISKIGFWANGYF